jgi:hypothetical protein
LTLFLCLREGSGLNNHLNGLSKLSVFHLSIDYSGSGTGEGFRGGSCLAELCWDAWEVDSRVSKFFTYKKIRSSVTLQPTVNTHIIDLAFILQKFFIS